jgi:hypothetical protein
LPAVVRTASAGEAEALPLHTVLPEGLPSVRRAKKRLKCDGCPGARSARYCCLAPAVSASVGGDGSFSGAVRASRNADFGRELCWRQKSTDPRGLREASPGLCTEGNFPDASMMHGVAFPEFRSVKGCCHADTAICPDRTVPTSSRCRSSTSSPVFSRGMPRSRAPAPAAAGEETQMPRAQQQARWGARRIWRVIVTRVGMG